MITRKINLNELREIIKEIINEATADEIKTKYYPDITQEIFNDIVNTDKITSNLENGKIGNYAKWLLNLYKKNNLKLEDLYKAEEYLPVFDKLSKANKLEIKDINKYKSLADLYNVIADYVGNDKTISKQDEIRKEKSGIKKIYEDNRFLVIQPLTEEAACYYGKGTQWCTASTNGNNMFNYYNSKGPLYIIMDKTKRNKVGDYEKYQIHFETAQFMDSSDEDIDFDEHKELKELMTKLIKHLNINGIELVKQNYKYLMFIPNPNEEVQLEAVKKYEDAIRFIPNPSEEVQLEAVKKNGLVIRYIKNPSEEVQLEAVKKNGFAIDYIKNPSEEVKLEAVKQNGLAIGYIPNPSEELKLEAVKRDGFAIRHIQNPSEEVQLEAVKKNAYAIRDIPNPSEEVQLEAVKENGDVIEYIKNPYPSVLKYLEGNNANINENTSLIRSIIKEVLNEYKWVK